MDRIISINTLTYQGYDLSTTMREISGLGIRYIELSYTMGYVLDLKEEDFSERSAQRIRSMLSDFGLSIVALSGHMDLGKEDSVKAFQRRMEFTKAIGARIINTITSQLIRECSFYKNIEELANFAESLDLIIALENPVFGEDHIINSGKTGALVIQKIGSDHVRLNYDFCNLFIYSKGKMRPETDYEHALPYAAHFHLKDMKREKTGWSYSEIGKGEIDYKTILHSLSEESRPIPMSIELPLRLKRDLDFAPQMGTSIIELSEIRRVLKGSFEFIKGALGIQR